MKILHLSDIHLTKHGEIIWGADTLSNLNKALDKIKEIPSMETIQNFIKWLKENNLIL